MNEAKQWRARLAQLQMLPGLDELPAETLLDGDLTALYLGVSAKTLANGRSGSGSIPYVKVGRAVRYRAGDVRAALKAVAP